MSIDDTLESQALSRRLRREALALRVIAVTMRTALRDLDQKPDADDRARWAVDLAWWVDGILDYHRRRVAILREEADEVRAPQAADELTSLLAGVDTALVQAAATAKAAHLRVKSRQSTS